MNDVPKMDEETRLLMGVPVDIQADVHTCLCLIATIQLACRHPHFKGPTRDVVTGLARMLQVKIGRTPLLRSMMAAGWERVFDVPCDGSKPTTPAGDRSN